jgi:hypothetical protein
MSRTYPVTDQNSGLAKYWVRLLNEAAGPEISLSATGFRRYMSRIIIDARTNCPAGTHCLFA